MSRSHLCWHKVALTQKRYINGSKQRFDQINALKEVISLFSIKKAKKAAPSIARSTNFFKKDNLYPACITNDCFQDRRRKLMKTAPVLQARLLHKKRVSLFFAKKEWNFLQHGAKTYLKLHYDHIISWPYIFYRYSKASLYAIIVYWKT